MREILLTPISWLYGLIVNIRHKLFDFGILKSVEFDIPIICVGNITVGGTGKTPHTEYLISMLSHSYNVAVLSRGYKRKSRGFQMVEVDSSYRHVGDEPKQIKRKFPNTFVAVCEDRVEGVKKLRKLHPEISLIILDDAFQHRYIEAWANVVLIDYNKPIYQDKFLPVGTLRDSKAQLQRANFVIMTKCPEAIKPIDLRIVSKNLGLLPYQKLFFTNIKQGELKPLFTTENHIMPTPGSSVIVMSGIARPEGFYNEIAKSYNVVGTMKFPDHHGYTVRDLKKLSALVRSNKEPVSVIMTEKDAVKLTNKSKIPKELIDILYYSPIEIRFLEYSETDFCRQMRQYVRKNYKYSIVHPQ